MSWIGDHAKFDPGTRPEFDDLMRGVEHPVKPDPLKPRGRWAEIWRGRRRGRGRRVVAGTAGSASYYGADDGREWQASHGGGLLPARRMMSGTMAATPGRT